MVSASDVYFLASSRVCDTSRAGLVGKFWHQRRVVYSIVSEYLRRRIPEINEVLPVSEVNLEDDRKMAPDTNGDRLEIERQGHEPDEIVVIRHRPGLTFTGYNLY